MNPFRFLASMLGGVRRVAPAEAAPRIRSGEAILIDVREPAEWKAGVAESARLLPMSDLVGRRRQWGPFLAEAAGKELLLYCAVGGRAGAAARILRAQGHRVGNAGGFRDWVAAGWPTTRPPGSA